MLKKAAVLTLVVLLVVSMVTVTGCSDTDKEADRYGGTLTVAGNLGLASLDPLTGTGGSEHVYLYPIFDTLLNFDEDLNLVSGLAEDWEVVDPTTIRLFLREGVKFHDGTDFNAEAVKFNIERSLSEVSMVRDLAAVASVEVVDEYTVDILLAVPNVAVLAALTDRAGMMASPAAVEEHGEDFTLNPVGTGPFVFDDWVPGSHVQYLKFEDYWQEGKPYLDQLVLKIIPSDPTRVAGLKTGEIDFLWYVPPQHAEELKEDDAVVVDVTSSLFAMCLGLNVSREPLDNVNVRQAINMAIDKEAILETVLLGYGSVTSQLFPTGYWATNEEIKHSFDPDQARQILIDEGVEGFELTLVTVATGANPRVFEIVVSQLQDVGIDAKLEIGDMQVIAGYLQGAVDALGIGWSGRADPQMSLNALYRSASMYNPGQWTNERVEALLNQAQAEYDVDARKAIYKELAEIILDESPFVILYNSDLVDAYSPDVKGYVQSVLGKPKFNDVWLDRSSE